MRTALIVTGLVSLAVLSFPELILVGLVLLVIPGLILGMMPTLFGYLAAMALIRAALPLRRGPKRTALAAVLAVALGWVAALPARANADMRFWWARKGDVIPSAPVVPAGHVRLERDGSLRRGEGCDALCAALLATPTVADVTIVDIEKERPVPRATYRLVPKGQAPDRGLRPIAVSTFRDYPGFAGYEARVADEKALAALWGLRLASTATMVQSSSRADADMTISLTEGETSKEPKVQRIEVRRSDGAVLLRRSLVTSSKLAVPLRLGLAGGLEHLHWVLDRTALSTGPRYAEFRHERELVAHLALAQPRLDGALPKLLRARLAAALAGSGKAEDLALASTWLESFGYRTPEGADVELVGRILSEPRIRDLKFFFKTHEKRAPAALRRAIGARLVMPGTSRDDRWRLARLLQGMPDSTFATLTQDEQRIVVDPALRRDAAPFLERVADQGPVAIPALLGILAEAAPIEPFNARSDRMEAARDGLARLGHAARPALPTILQMFGSSGGQLTHDWRDALNWRVAMVEMGLDPAALPWPREMDKETLARERAEVERQLKLRRAKAASD